MNGSRASLAEVALIAQSARELRVAETLLCLPSALIGAAANFGLPIGGQDCSPELNGAFTGDQSAALLADVGARAVIVGHSERRTLHGETDMLVSQKALAARAAGLRAVICIGETADDRAAGNTIEQIDRQLRGSLPDAATAQNTIVAYEPVWAIGTGQSASASDIAEVHGHVRQQLRNRFANGGRISILYGGSLNASNAAEIFGLDHVDGGLVGGASLRAKGFLPIMTALDQAATT